MAGITHSSLISPDDISSLGYQHARSPASSTSGSLSALGLAPPLEQSTAPSIDAHRNGRIIPLQPLGPPYTLQYPHSAQGQFAPSMLAQLQAHQQPQYQQTLVTNYVVNGKPGVFDPIKRKTKRNSHSHAPSVDGIHGIEPYTPLRQTPAQQSNVYSKTIYTGTYTTGPVPAHIVPTTPVHDQQAWQMMTPIHVHGQIQLPTPPMTNEDHTSATPQLSAQALYARPSVASVSSHISAASVSAGSNASSSQSKPQTPKKRTLKIKRSETEGRRLVFPDAPSSPETSAKDVTSETEDDETPSTPKKRRSPRLVPISGLTQTPMGTVSFGTHEVLATDYSWLQPGPFSSSPSRDDDDLERAGMINRGPLPVGMTNSASRFEGLSKAERKRKRLQAFRNVSMDAGYSRENMLTTLKGIGRVACGQDLATKFLVPTGASVTVESQENSSIASLPRSDSARDTSTLQPAWPDSHFPWNASDFDRKQQVDNSKRVERVRRMALLEKYLDQVSDDEGEDFDSRAALRQYMVEGPVARPSDAREAIFQVKRDGKPLVSRETFQLPPGIPIASYDDETGCVCRGSNEEGGAMVCCDSCGVWHHMMCVGVETEEDLGDQWYCWQCSREGESAERHSTPKPEERLVGSAPMQPTFSANEDAPRSFQAHSSDTALAPSPIFSTSGKFLVPDTPGLYLNTPRVPSNTASSYTPRVPSSSSLATKFATPATPSSRGRTVSYAEHYNVCQTPGAADLDYTKVYATPKFEDLFDTGFTPLRASPTPGGSAMSETNKSYDEFRTPTTTQNFFKGLHTGGSQPTPGLEHLSSAISSNSTYPGSPISFPPKLNSELTTSPSPFRSHRRQVSFGNRITSQSYSASHLRESVIIEERTGPDSTPDGHPAKNHSAASQEHQGRREELRFGEEL
ncbi:hypothetical protein NliqN6_5676 [Naganishia liquefaciens]|uniref:PHD-type domain-containing protein n=1 Tax=Naganishia liquefaciens TaxID=104408 RepID=A0A8H3YGY8_9TREE|nr:hypothetical protein NliqN6_5676 [Naganishia liquefaciens]